MWSLTEIAILSTSANSAGSVYMWNLDTNGGWGAGALDGYGGASSPSTYSEDAAMYSDRRSCINSIISWLCFSTNAAVAALYQDKYWLVKMFPKISVRTVTSIKQ